MAVNQEFIEKTNFLKNKKNFKHGDICARLNVPRYKYDAYRNGKTRVPVDVIGDLNELFPELKEYKRKSINREPSTEYGKSENLEFELKEVIVSNQLELVKSQKALERVFEFNNILFEALAKYLPEEEAAVLRSEWEKVVSSVKK